MNRYSILYQKPEDKQPKEEQIVGSREVPEPNITGYVVTSRTIDDALFQFHQKYKNKVVIAIHQIDDGGRLTY